MAPRTTKINLPFHVQLSAATRRRDLRPLTDMPDGVCRDRAQAFMRRMGESSALDVSAAVPVITIYDEIGFFGVSAQDVRGMLDEIDAPRIKVRINSPGGDAFDGVAIYNDLLAHPAEIDIEITGVAASAASIIAMAGDTVRIAKTAFIMIHNAWALVMGDKREMREFADVLEKIDTSIGSAYAARTGIDPKMIAVMMDAETWLSGDEAVEKGFADEISSDAGQDANALFDFSAFEHVPAQLKRRTEAALRDAGYSRTDARTAVSGGFQYLPDPDRRDAVQADRRDAGPPDLQPLRDTISDLRSRLGV